MSSKKPRLKEKPVRIPDSRPFIWEDAIKRYLKEVEPLNSETARATRFAMLTQELFGIEPNFIDNYVSGIEKYVKKEHKKPPGGLEPPGGYIFRGKVDNLFGNLIIEFEHSISVNLNEAREQLRRYTAILWSNESPDKRTPFIGIATDGVRFNTYTPVLKDLSKAEISPADIELQELEKTDWTKVDAQTVYYWLDRYLLRKEILHPTSESIVKDFGLQSHAFQTAGKLLSFAWEAVKSQSSFEVIFGAWSKYLKIVYGTNIADDALFIRHTYLATLAKLMSWWRLSDSPELPDDDEIVRLLEGQLFKAHGIENYIEEDFFSWLARIGVRDAGIKIVNRLFSLLHSYNIRELSEDVLKSLYQELVDPETRHDLGEFYTPDWLAHRIVSKILDEKPDAALLDPACGSGTFLYLSIREKRRRLGDSAATLNHIFNHIVGADIHPLAVIVAKTNYILALGDLLAKRHGSVSIPVYLADTVKLPEQILSGQQYHILLDGKSAYINQVLLNDLSVYDHGVEMAKDFAEKNKNQSVKPENFRNYLVAQRFPQIGDEAIVNALFDVVKTLKHFIDKDRDTIWAYVLKNIYKPLFLRKKFDAVIGNPPWIAYRYMTPDYQKFLKQQITRDYQLLSGHGELMTHMEIATLFLIKAADIYLKQGGCVGFVLPRSLFSADQHDNIRQSQFKLVESREQTLIWTELWDCENIQPLFNVPACVLFGCKVTNYVPIKALLPGEVLSGKLNRKNASLAEANEQLQIQTEQFRLFTQGERSYWSSQNKPLLTGASYYKSKFAQGATIVPRSFWFVKIRPSKLGFNPDLPPVETADRAAEMAKDAYQGLILRGNVESRFLYKTIISTDLLPFGYLSFRLILLPIECKNSRYNLLDSKIVHTKGYFHIAEWLQNAEKEWKIRRADKANSMDIYQRLDRIRGITRQNPKSKFKVIYNTSGTYLTASITDNLDLRSIDRDEKLKVSGVIADYKTYFFETDEINEANYLCSILNSPKINELIKPMQSRGLWGPRDICKTVLELPIPKFDPENADHQHLAAIGEVCAAKVRQWIDSGGPGKITSIGKLRGMVRELLREELREIDGVVEGMIDNRSKIIRN